MQPSEIHRELSAVYGTGVMTVQHVRKWCREFENGRVSVLDEQRTGRPSTSARHVDDIDAAVKANRRVCLAELSKQFDLSYGTVWDIVHQRLGYRKVSSRWVPRLLTEEHKKMRMATSLEILQRYAEHGERFLCKIVTGDETWVFHYAPESKAESMRWKHPGSPVAKKFKTTTSSGKMMATMFWDMYGLLLVEYTPRSATVNAVAYQATLKKLKEAIRRKRPGLLSQGVLLLHDNARPHIARDTRNLLDSWHWEILPHPAYSPDLAPSDFHLFPKLKKHLRGQRFHSDDDVKEAVGDWLRQ